MPKFKVGDKIIVTNPNLSSSYTYNKAYSIGKIYTLNAHIGGFLWRVETTAPAGNLIYEWEMVKLPNDFEGLTEVDKILYDIKENT